ncbi:nucleotidyltransferase [Pediococcus inopinatus]|uniref:tRNA(Met) cytidine acetate ligase n=1 Tax=Pediococcus inopinatus TaxID=114090 RepID=A0ABZ0Q808_9LACO|nr:nucleotidyltransferase [Pediococcus inopinatus]WPC22474.1 nucleotidyltransferase [Pediococcus inopinatus]WPP08593.1 nucleotidyltransferase [Pediococcus inopinatus]
MKICSVIAEFDPFHNGHQYLLDQAKKLTHADVLVVFMSGNFLQRGEPAIVDKWKRTREALSGRADLVIELPINVSMQAAHLFAFGAVQMATLIESDYLVFGSEHPQVDYQMLAKEAQQLKLTTKSFTQNFASQLFTALREKTGVDLKSANDILAFNYFRAAQQIGTTMQLLPVMRKEAGHDELSLDFEHITSASAIRRARLEDLSNYQKFIPDQTKTDLSGTVIDWSKLWPFLKYRILTESEMTLKNIYGMSEGLEFRFKKVIHNSSDMASFLSQMKSKRYTYTHLQRLCLAIVLNLKDSQMLNQPAVLRVLGFNENGQQLLHRLAKLELPLLSKIGQNQMTINYQTTLRADNIYGLISHTEQNIGRKPIIFP